MRGLDGLAWRFEEDAGKWWLYDRDGRVAVVFQRRCCALAASGHADLRRSPIEFRKAKLAKLVRGLHPGIVLNEHYEGDGDIVFKHAASSAARASCQSASKSRSSRPFFRPPGLIAICR